MRESDEDLLAEIDATIDQLLENAKAMKEAKRDAHSNHEIQAFEKTQESLLARLIHRESILGLEKKQKMLQSIRTEDVHKKIAEFARKSLRRQNRASTRKARSKSRG